MNNTNFALIAVVLFLAIAVVPGFAAGEGITITITNFTALNISSAEQHTIFDVGNATAPNYTIIANITSSGADTDGTVGQYTLNFTNVTFILPFGINPTNQGECNVTTANFIGNTANTTSNGTYNLTHQACSIGNFSLNLDPDEGGGTRFSSINVTLNVTANMSALAMNHLARGASTIPAMIYAIVNATNNSSGYPVGGAASAVVQLNATSFWINPRPYAYTAGDAASNGTVYVMGWNQTRNGYQVMAPLMSYNSTLGYPVTASNTFGEVVYFDRTPMEAASANDTGDPMYMELFSYNLTFRIIAPFAQNGSAAQTYYINSPATAGNQTLMPLLVRRETVNGMMGESITMVMGTPSQTGFTVLYGVNGSAPSGGSSGTYTEANLSSLVGVNLTYAAAYDASTPMLTITSSNVSAINNTDISILFTLMDLSNQRAGTPIFIQAQQISGFDMTAPPKLGQSIVTTFLMNITNMLDNYTLSNLSIRFMMPKNATVVVNGSDNRYTHNITNFDNASLTYTNQTTGYSSYMVGWGVAANYTKNIDMIERFAGPTQGTNVSIWFQFIDVLLSNGTFNSWLPGAQSGFRGYAAMNFTEFMSFPIMNQSANTPGTAGSTNTYNVTVQMPMEGRLNLTDKLPGFTAAGVSSYTVNLDGVTLSATDGNMTIGSLFLNNVDSGSHSVSVSYTTASPSASPTGSTSGGVGAAGADIIILANEIEKTFTANAGYVISVNFGVPAGGTTSEIHSIKVNSISGTIVTLTISSTPITVDIAVGQTKYVDIDNDDVNDLKVLVTKLLTAESVEMTVTKLRAAKAAVAEEAPSAKVAAPPVEEAPLAEEAPSEVSAKIGAPEEAKLGISQTVVILIVAIIVILGLGYWYTTKK